MKAGRVRNAWIGVCVVISVFFVLTKDLSPLHEILWWALGLASAGVIVFSVIVRPLWARSAWLCVAAAFISFVIADILWAIQGRTTMPPSGLLASFENFFLALTVILLITAALLLVHRRRRNMNDSSGFLDAAVVFVAASMVVAEYLIYPIWQSPDIKTSQSVVLIVFEMLNLLLLSATVRLWFATDRSVNRSIRTLATAFLVLVFANTFSLLAWLPDAWHNSDASALVVEACGILAFAIVGAAALDPTAARPPAADADAGLSARSRVMVVLGLCILVPPVLLLLHGSASSFTSGRSFVVLTLVLTLLLGLRVNLLVQGYREAVRREHTLREINAGLMRSTDLHDVNSRLSDWAARLVEQPDVGCLLGTSQEMTALGIGSFGARYRAASGQIRYRTVVTVPGTQPQRRLVVETPDIVTSPAQASLAVLGQSVGMALERIALSRRVVERATTERLQLLLHNASDVIALVDNNARIRYVTEAMHDLTGHAPAEVVGIPWPSLFQDPALAVGLLQRAREEVESRGDLVIDPMAVAHPPETQDESDPEASSVDLERRVEVDVAWLESEQQFVVTHHDVTDRYRLEQQLAFQAFHDELTGLNNRAVFHDELVRAAARSRRSKSPFAVMMIDLDDFKNVNDSLGHPAGDELLKAVANRLVECMREGDIPVRLGGDEFAVILESARSAEDAEAVGQRLLESLAEPVNLRGTEVVARASIGIAISDGHQEPADVERDADIALYDAKFTGKGRIAVFRSGMHDEAVRKLSLTNQLRGALLRDEFILRYQPVYELTSGDIAGVEALVRWIHPTRGELVPDMFIALAEDSGYIIDIGHYVINKALADLAVWSELYPQFAQSRLTVNISGRQLQVDDVALTLAHALTITGIPPYRLAVEVTESVLVPDDGVAAAQLRAIADLGVSIYIDDFGTGWASLHYLRTLPVSGLKLAQEFVSGLPDEFDGGLARAIKELGASMSLEEVIAEGIETTDQREALINLGYRLGQGYLMSKPLTVTELHALLAVSRAAVWNIAQPGDPVLGYSADAAGPRP